MQQPYFFYWGKAKPSHHAPNYHLLVYHSLDVAAMGKVILEKNLFYTDAMLAKFQCDKQQFSALFSYLLVLHDLGKFASAFQSLVSVEHSPLVNSQSAFGYDVKHDSLGFALWRFFESDYAKSTAQFAQYFADFDVDNLDLLIQVVTGHHGQPPCLNSKSMRITNYFTEHDQQAAWQFVEDCRWLLPTTLPAIASDSERYELLKTYSWLLAGITTIADWLGSDQDSFPYRQQPQDLHHYFNNIALPQAHEMLQRIGYQQQAQLQPFTSISALCPFIQQPTPLQQYSAEVNITSGPQLFILEDITGAGKTEAALILAQRLMSQGQGQGVYIALPTMATSNAMFNRMADVYLGLFTPAKKPSLALAHGARHLSEKFSDMVQLSRQASDFDYSPDEQSASAWCNYWYVDNRKKSLLADVGVGTVDQALLAILPNKHQSLRMLGLASKVLIIDEIHCYAAYESRLIEKLIYCHTCLGGSTILLSATMPYVLRCQMVKAYYAATALGEGKIEVQADFPWVTHCSPVDLQEKPIAARQAVARSVAVNYHSEEQALWDLIERSLIQGKSVCWIKNTVDETIACYHQAQLRFGDIASGITLFHSRFCMSDRIHIEQQVLNSFGKTSTPQQRRGQLCIASPILDQSLDIDISVMITEVAPIDVLIQRLGRCCRHLRDADEAIIEDPSEHSQDGRGMATLFIHGPAYTEEPSQDWLRANFKGTQAVYGDPSVIWRTVKILEQLKMIALPSQARTLIEAVYGPEERLNVPKELDLSHQKILGEQQAKQYMATLNGVNFGCGYTEDAANGQWSDEIHTPTRLAEESSDFILLIPVEHPVNQQHMEAELQFYYDTDHYPVDMNKISLYDYYLSACDPQILKKYQQALQRLEEDYPAFKYAKPLIFVEKQANEWITHGCIIRRDEHDNIKETQQVELRYDAKMGLRKS